MNALNKIAAPSKLSLGLVFPLEAYKGSIATMKDQENLAKKAEALGFSALWFRDVPFNDPNFGDAGQLYDPWVYMTHIMNQTKEIVLASGSIILPLRHPVHTAKAMQSLQELSGGRFLMGIASGDRPVEYPAFNKELAERAELFREAFAYIKALTGDFPKHNSQHFGQLNGQIDLLPKTEHKTSFLVTGHSGQSLDWIAKNADGWLYYPRNFDFLRSSMANWKAALAKQEQGWKPYMQSLYIDLLEEENASPSPIHLGFRSGSDYLKTHLNWLRSFDVNHVILNLKYSSRPAQDVVEQLGEEVLPHLAAVAEKI